MKKELKKVVQNELNPNVSVDCVIFGFDLERLTVLLIDRGGNTKNIGPRLALPGNLIYNNENLIKQLKDFNCELIKILK